MGQPTLIRVGRPAMGSLFEIYAGGEDAEALEQKAQAALDRVDWLEQQLSPYRPDSDLSQINAWAYQAPVPVAPNLFALLQRMRAWSEETEGAFDPTAGKLVRLWGFAAGPQIAKEEPEPPAPEQLAQMVAQIGWRHVQLDPQAQTIRFLTPEVALHLGAVGKGYIVQSAADFLRAEGVACALLHSGQSSIVALGAPPDTEGWEIGLPHPLDAPHSPPTLTLRDASLSTSGNTEQFKRVGGRYYGHLLDPRTGYPVMGPHAVSVVSADATEGDALSTAFYVQGRPWTEAFCRTHPALQVLFV